MITQIQGMIPVGWLIDENTEYARMILGSDWQRAKMGVYNQLVVTLIDAQNAIAKAVAEEQSRKQENDWPDIINKY